MPAVEKEPVSIDSCHCFTMRKAARQITRFYDEQLASTGLRVTQFLILAVLNDAGAMAVNPLAERLDIERTAMGKTLNPLERDGLVRVKPSPTDGRSRVAELTAKGKSLYERAAPLWQKAQREFRAQNENAAALRRSLQEIKLA